jgi:hypothetical protein
MENAVCESTSIDDEGSKSPSQSLLDAKLEKEKKTSTKPRFFIQDSRQQGLIRNLVKFLSQHKAKP